MLMGLRRSSAVRSVSRHLERALSRSARRVWPLVRKLNVAIERPSPAPKWAPGPLLKRRERSFPTLGWPRETDSLCPKCVKEVRTQILSGERDLSLLVDGKPGEIRARIVEQDGEVRMVKTATCTGASRTSCRSIPAFLARIERLYPGRDFLAPLTSLRDHGTSSVKYGRGSVLTVDLTNRCNMMCDPCFMDANQVGYVHELGWDEIQKILDDSLTIQPRRQMSVQFSGGEPTLSPHFLQAIRVREGRRVLLRPVRHQRRPLRARARVRPGRASEAGLRLAYLQFDGVTNDANSHRKVGNLFDVKLRAIENLHAAGIDVVLVVTVVNGVNNEQVGPIVDFAIANADKITVVSFQPVSFTGRDEDVSDEVRATQRYTLSPPRPRRQDADRDDRAPARLVPALGDGSLQRLDRHAHGRAADWGALKCGCHPNCGMGTVLFVNKRTKQMVPLTVVPQPRAAPRRRAGHHRRRPGPSRHARRGERWPSSRTSTPTARPPGFTFAQLVSQFLSQTGNRGRRVGEFEGDATEFEWRVFFVAGMWFQDLYNYDFRRTEMCIIPYGTQIGEISFCAYNTGVGWRNVIEKMKANATVAEWYRRTGGTRSTRRTRTLPLPDALGTVVLPPSASAMEKRDRARRRLPMATEP